MIPPKEWRPRKSYDDIGSMRIGTPISQFVTGQQGMYQVYNIQKKAISFHDFSEMANSDRYVNVYVTVSRACLYILSLLPKLPTSLQRHRDLVTWIASVPDSLSLGQRLSHE